MPLRRLDDALLSTLRNLSSLIHLPQLQAFSDSVAFAFQPAFPHLTAINKVITDLTQGGDIGVFYQNYFQSTTCTAAPAASDTSQLQLSVRTLGGVFVFLGVIGGFALLIWLSQICIVRCTHGARQSWDFILGRGHFAGNDSVDGDAETFATRAHRRMIALPYPAPSTTHDPSASFTIHGV